MFKFGCAFEEEAATARLTGPVKPLTKTTPIVEVPLIPASTGPMFVGEAVK